MGKKMDKFLFFSCCYASFINGMLILMTGAILTYLMQDYSLTYVQGGLLVSVQAVGNLVAGLLSGIIIQGLGRRKSMFFVATMFTVGFGGIAIISSPILLFVLMFLSGLGWGINNNLVNTLVSEESGGDGGYINILHMGFAVGAFISPLMVGAFIKWGISWKIAVLIIAIASSSIILMFLKVPINEPLKEKGGKGKLSFDFLKDIRYFVYLLILFTYVGVETGLNSWLVSYLVERGIVDIGKAQLMLSLLWVVIIFGRMFTAYIFKFIRKDFILIGQSILMFVFYGLFLFNKNPLMVGILVIGIGISMAGIYPTTIANASYILAGAGLGSGLLLAGGGLGATVVPYITGAIAENKGIQIGMISNLIIIMVMVILAVFNIILINKDKKTYKNI